MRGGRDCACRRPLRPRCLAAIHCAQGRGGRTRRAPLRPAGERRRICEPCRRRGQSGGAGHGLFLSRRRSSDLQVRVCSEAHPCQCRGLYTRSRDTARTALVPPWLCVRAAGSSGIRNNARCLGHDRCGRGCGRYGRSGRKRLRWRCGWRHRYQSGWVDVGIGERVVSGRYGGRRDRIVDAQRWLVAGRGGRIVVLDTS